ncbi:MAG: PHP domain-containing protein [Cyclobacteriaceae bacterium]
MENKEISKILKFTSSIMELHGENEFKSRSYSIASYKIDQLTNPLSVLSADQIAEIDGLGKSMSAKIRELIDTGKLTALEEYLEKTPLGVLDMLQLKGIGPKKIRVVWNELGIEDIDSLEQAGLDDQISKLKGFGKKTQQTILDAIAYRKANTGLLLYAEAEAIANELLLLLSEKFDVKFSVTGELRRKCEIVQKIELLAGTEENGKIIDFLSELENINYLPEISGPFSWRGHIREPYADVLIRFCAPSDFHNQLLLKTASINHLNYTKEQQPFIEILKKQAFDSEEAAYRAIGLPYIVPELREGRFEFELAEKDELPNLIETKDIKGIIHCHSTYSDGAHSLEEMATHCKESGFEYLGITDHSKTAVYASGLKEDDIKRQHDEIDRLNEKLHPFKIFKGIESDILGDGSLDYDDDVLDSFDFIIGSIHSNIKMEEAQATERIINAINNPYTTMIGHLTARVLLQRPGFPVDYDKVIEACVNNEVILELNAHPSRLDLDWRWLRTALTKGMITCINPDSHRKEGYRDIYYGTQVARKAGLEAGQCLNTRSLKDITAYFDERKTKALSRA